MSTENKTQVVIVGAGHAGGSATAFLRQFGFQGRIILVGDEDLPPYQRPPLSKAWLKGEADADSLLLRSASWYVENDIDLRLDTRVEALDLQTREVRLDGGARIGFDHLVLATGARARKLVIPGADLYGVLALRSARDAEALKTTLGPGRRLAVIGGGYVGLEAAASARSLGAEAVVIERASRVLARVACEELSIFYTDQHVSHGVRFEVGAEVRSLEGVDGRVTGVRLGDGRMIDCDAALVGVGAIPNDELAQVAGVRCEDGIVVDMQAQTSAPGVFAIGDVTRRPMPHYERMHRLESVPNALEQARQAAAVIVGRPAPPHEVPWFWSDQYDLKLQIAGLPFDCDQRVIRGEPRSARFAIFHLHEGRVRAVEAVNAPSEFMVGRQLIAKAAAIEPARLADTALSMKAFLV